MSVFGWIEAFAIPLMWLIWAATWVLAAGNTKQNAQQETGLARISYLLAFVLAGLLIGLPRQPINWLSIRFIPDTRLFLLCGVLLTGFGLGFATWARFRLGRNWSGTVALKVDQQLVTTGPYAFTRHPIYSGILLAFAGTAIARGELRAILAIVVVFFALRAKLATEEAFLTTAFGHEYLNYQKRVRAIIPFVL